MEKFIATANEILTWGSNNIEAALAVAAVTTTVLIMAYRRLSDYFAKPTPTGFDDPRVKAPRDRNREIFKRLGLPHSDL